MTSFRSKSILISSYVRIAYAEDIEEYCRERFKTVGFSGIVNNHTVSQGRATLWSEGKTKVDKRLSAFYLPPAIYPAFFPAIFFLHFCQLLYACLVMRQRFDYYLGVGYFFTYVGGILQRLGLVGEVIYYAYDYFPTNLDDSFRVKIINGLFRYLDARAIRSSTAIWCLAQPLADIYREKAGDRPIYVVPLAIRRKKVKRTTHPSKDNLHLFFVGILKDNQGLDTLLEVLADKRFAHVQFEIVGGGTYKEHLTHLVDTYRLHDRVRLHGFVDDNAKVAELIGQSHFGIALFADRGQEDFSLLTDTGKVKFYFAYDLPVVVASNFVVSTDVAEKKLGYVTHTEKGLVADVLERISKLTPLQYKEMGENVVAYSESMTPFNVFDRAFEQTIGKK